MSDRDEDKCMNCDASLTLHEEKRSGVCTGCASEEEDDWLSGLSCNPNNPEECEACQ